MPRWKKRYSVPRDTDTGDALSVRVYQYNRHVSPTGRIMDGDYAGYVAARHWPLEDPARATGSEDEVMAEFRRIRDEIRERVAELINVASDPG